MKVIGISGKAGSGKDTVFSIIKSDLENKGYRVTQLSFAKKLKDACSILFGFNRDKLDHDFEYKESMILPSGKIDPACEMLGMTRRTIMQRLGTEAIRNNFHQDTWVITLKLAILNGEYNDYDYGFVTDCRFLNEIDFVKGMDGKLILVNRCGSTKTLTAEIKHSSETEWEQNTKWDFVIPNEVHDHLSQEENLEKLKNKIRNTIGEDL